jgi:tetratricopeptide (TPR) repeat protein
MIYNRILLTILAGTILLSGCQKPDPEKAYRDAMNLKNIPARVNALNDFVTTYPQDENLSRAYSRLFRDYLELGQTEHALKAAQNYLNIYPEDARTFNYNSVAWTLAEKGVGLDSARVYARRAVALAKKNQIRQLPMLQDTYAYVLYRLGEYPAAEAVQGEAMVGHENDSEYLHHYALILHANGKAAKAFDVMARAILNDAGSDARNTMRTWLDDIKPENERRKTASGITEKAVQEFLAVRDNAMRRGWCALLYAVCGTNLEKAEAWAVEGTKNVQGSTDSDIILAAYSNLAAVYQALGRHADMIRVLESVRNEAMPYDEAYWLELGSAYQEAGQQDKALDAFINGLTFQKSDALMKAAGNIEPDLAVLEKKIEAAKNEMTEFDGGKFDPASVTSDRVAIVELFTGSECPPCVGADEALDKIAGYYPRSVMALLEYHLHIPRPDPMTNPSTEARYAFYGRDFGTPTVFINGSEKYTGGGPEIVIRNLYNKYRSRIDTTLRKPANISLDCSAEREGDIVSVTVTAGTKNTLPDSTGLFIALVEKAVNYTGGNGVSRHLFVVRKLLGADEPLRMKLEDGTGSVASQIDISKVEAEIRQYLDNFTQHPPERHRTFKGWATRPEKLNRDNLAVICWLQNTVSKEILQAVYKNI